VRRALPVTPLLLIAAVLAGCGGQKTSATSTPATSPATTTAPTTTQAAETTLTVYRVHDGILRPENVTVPATQAVATATLHALGVDAGVAIADGTATVDAPGASDDQVAEIVYTLTQFPTVSRVDVGGRTGLTRADEASYAPLILVDAPAAGATVPATIRVAGSAVVFEATLVVELVRDGAVLDRQTVTATAGAPERGSFETTLHAPSPGAATIEAYAPSAEDGSRQHEIDVPVTVSG
jgi:hypothetical protein